MHLHLIETNENNKHVHLHFYVICLDLKVLKITGKVVICESVVYLALLRIQPLNELVLPLAAVLHKFNLTNPISFHIIKHGYFKLCIYIFQQTYLSERSLNLLKSYHETVTMQPTEPKPGQQQ